MFISTKTKNNSLIMVSNIFHSILSFLDTMVFIPTSNCIWTAIESFAAVLSGGENHETLAALALYKAAIFYKHSFLSTSV